MKFNFTNIIERFNKLNDQMRYGILGFAVILVLLLDVFLFVLPQMGGMGDLNDQIKKLSDDTNQVLIDRQRTAQLRKNLQQTRLDLKELSSKVRYTQEVPVILETISSIANKYTVKIDQLVPEKQHELPLSASEDGKYYSLPIVIKAHGGYHMFGRFLNKLENERLYFNLREFIVQNGDKDPNVHFFSLTIDVVLLDQNVNHSKNL